MNEVPDAIVCEGCDAVYRARRLRRREVSHCRAAAPSSTAMPATRRRVLPLTVASLILFAIANLFPIVEIELKGLSSETTLAGAVVALSAEGMSPVALLVLATTCCSRCCAAVHPVLPAGADALRAPAGRLRCPGRPWQALRPWGMIEVFLLGVLVAIIKLSSMAQVVAGPALWALHGSRCCVDGGAVLQPPHLLGNGLRAAAGAAGMSDAGVEEKMTETAAAAHGLPATATGTTWRDAARATRPATRCGTHLHRAQARQHQAHLGLP